MDIVTNWRPENGIRLCNIVQESDELPDGDLVDLLDEDKCVSLARVPEHHPKECTVRFVTSGKVTNWSADDACQLQRMLLSGIKILSESRVMEICLGAHEEYYTTVHGVLMGDFGDSKMYVNEVKFETPQDVVFIKLKGLCMDDSVWIYSLHVAVTIEGQVQGTEKYNSGNFSREHLASVFKDKGVHLSKDADKFRQMLEGFNSGVGDHNNKYLSSNPMNIMSMMFGAGKNKSFSKNYDLDCRNGNKCEEKGNLTDAKDSVHMSKFFPLIENCLSSENGYEYSTSRERECTFNNQNEEENLKDNSLSSKCDTIQGDQFVKGEIERSIGISQPMSNIIDQLQALSCGGRSFINEPSECKSVIDMLSTPSTVSNCSVKSADSNDILHAPETSGENSECLGCKCERDKKKYDEIKSLVDQRLAVMEERLLKKIEEKFEEQSKNEGQRLKKIEELLSRISEKL